eukprot:3799575-Rhodomonas_salina.3
MVNCTKTAVSVVTENEANPQIPGYALSVVAARDFPACLAPYCCTPIELNSPNTAKWPDTAIAKMQFDAPNGPRKCRRTYSGYPGTDFIRGSRPEV